MSHISHVQLLLSFLSVDSCLQDNYTYLKEELGKVASEFGEKVLSTPGNDISIGELDHMHLILCILYINVVLYILYFI